MPFTQSCIIRASNRNLGLIIHHARHSDLDALVSKVLETIKRRPFQVAIIDYKDVIKQVFLIGSSEVVNENAEVTEVAGIVAICRSCKVNS